MVRRLADPLTGEDIRRIRETIGTVDDLAQLLGVASPTVYRWQQHGLAAPVVDGLPRLLLEHLRDRLPKSASARAQLLHDLRTGLALGGQLGQIFMLLRTRFQTVRGSLRGAEK